MEHRRGYALSGITTPDTTQAEDVRLARAVGAEGIGVWQYKLDRDGLTAADTRRMLDEGGLRATNCVAVGNSVFPYELAPEPAEPAARVEALLPRIEELAVLGAESLIVITGPAPAGVDDAWTVARAALERIGAAASDAGAVVALEMMHPDHAAALSIVSTLEAAARLVEGTGIKLVVDTWHVAREPLHELERWAPQVAGVQVADWRPGSTTWPDRACPGEGTLPLDQMLTLLRAGGFGGLWDVEIFSDDGRYGAPLADSLWRLPPAVLVDRATRWFREEGDVRDVGVGIVGAGFVGALHAEALAQVPAARLAAVAASQEASAQRFAERHGVASSYGDWRRLAEDPEVHLVDVALPNDLHRDVVVAAAAAGKHVVVEKPLARTLAEADEMVAACRSAGILLMYAEELCFAPKYVRAKELADSGGAQPRVPRTAGRAARRTPRRVVLGRRAVGWRGAAGHGLPRDRVLPVGPGQTGRRAHQGRRPCDRRRHVRGSSLHTYSGVGYGYAVEKAASTLGWSFTMFEELWNYGFPQEMRHFVDCVQHGTAPLETGEDGRAVLELLYAAYLAAGPAGRVDLPLTRTGRRGRHPGPAVARPVTAGPAH